MDRPRVRSPRPWVAASNLSVGSGVIIIISYWAHLTASALFRAGPRGPMSGRLSMTTSWRTGPAPMVSRCLSATGVRFSVIRYPPRSSALLTVGLPSTTRRARTSTGLPRSARTSCDRGGRPLCPGDDGAHPGPGPLPGRRLPHRNGKSLHPAPASHRAGPALNEASTKGSRV